MRPSVQQYAAFRDYLPEAHSWDKHIPLLGGSRFVVFLAPDAGVGRLVATPTVAGPGTVGGYTLRTPPEGPEFTADHPRLHYGWKATTEYRSRFGYLDYMWRGGPSETYIRDAGLPITLSDEVERRCGFVLYPYVSRMFADAVTWDIHEKAIARMRSGAAHPARKELLELACLAEALKDAWDVLADADREWLVCHEDAVSDAPPRKVRKYFDLHEKIRAVSSILRHQEVGKIRHALRELDDWALRGGVHAS